MYCMWDVYRLMCDKHGTRCSSILITKVYCILPSMHWQGLKVSEKTEGGTWPLRLNRHCAYAAHPLIYLKQALLCLQLRQNDFVYDMKT